MKLINMLIVCVLTSSCVTPDGEFPKPETPKEECITLSGLNEKTLIGGRPANPADWPASVYISAGGGRCSATIVGRQVVLSAAHCMKPGGQITFAVGPNRYSAVCDHHPNYTSNQTADFALCLTNRPVTGISYESLVTQAPFKIGDQILLTGYGCIRKNGSGGNDGVFRIGEASVTRLPVGKSYDTVVSKGAALCFGDSGGAAYLLEQGNRRRVFAVNSRGNIETTSYLSSVWWGDAWMIKWADGKNQKICGLHSDAEGCRGAVAPKPCEG